MKFGPVRTITETEVIDTFTVRAKTIEEENIDIRRDREKAYPSVGDQLDAIWKQIAEDKRLGKTLLSETDTMLGSAEDETSILGVKAKFLKK